MKFSYPALLVALTLGATAAAQTAPAPVQPAPVLLAPVQLSQTPTVTVSSLSLSAASKIVQLAVETCASRGYNVAATVVDRSGVTLSVARAENAGVHTVGASFSKAYTSASLRSPTSGVAEGIQKNPANAGVASIPGFLVLAGGLPIRVGNVVVGAVGVGGAPSGLFDEQCADAAVKSVLGQ